MRYLFVLFGAALASELNFETFEAQPYGEFLSGLFSGLTNNNVACVASASSTSESLNLLVNSIKTYESNYLPILTGFNDFKLSIVKMAEDCNIEGLAVTVHKLLGPWGKSIVMKNYVMHSRQISRDLEVLKTCSDNFNKCGSSAGEIFRLLSGWSIKMSLLEKSNGNEISELEALVTSVANSIEWIAPEYCDEAKNRLPISELVQGWISLQQNEKGAVESIVNTLMTSWVKDEDFQDCAMHYGGMALYVLPSILTNPSTWKLAYESEANTINVSFNHIMSTCSKDYSSCGTQIGELVNLLLKYTIDL